MAAKSHHTITVCTDCRRLAPNDLAAAAIAGLLRERLDEGAPPASHFAIRGTACMAACDTPCAVAFQAEGKASYLFSRISSDADVKALVDFAKLYAERPDGMSRQCERPKLLARKTLARIPSLVSKKTGGQHEL